jgi:hypothetical protein
MASVISADSISFNAQRGQNLQSNSAGTLLDLLYTLIHVAAQHLTTPQVVKALSLPCCVSCLQGSCGLMFVASTAPCVVTTSTQSQGTWMNIPRLQTAHWSGQHQPAAVSAAPG